MTDTLHEPTTDPLTTITWIYAAFGRGDVPAILDLAAMEALQ